MRFRIAHRTTYAYESPAYESFNEVRLQPASDSTQTCLDFQLSVDPPASLITFRDYYGNIVHDFGIPYLHDRLSLEATSEVVTFAGIDEASAGPREGDEDLSPPLHELASDQQFAEDHAEFLMPSTYISLETASAAMATQLRSENSSETALSFFQRASDTVHDRLTYEIGATTVHSTVAQVLAGGRGVCQDFAHLLISLCRHSGLPAKYVSGYLGNVEKSAASHAWAEAFIPPYGWIGMDSTAGTPATGRHVKVATGRDYADVAVVRGSYRGGDAAALEVEVESETMSESATLASGSRKFGPLIQYQSLGTLKQLQRLGALSQTLAAMAPATTTSQSVGDMMPVSREESSEGGAPRQQPQQQQQVDKWSFTEFYPNRRVTGLDLRKATVDRN